MKDNVYIGARYVVSPEGEYDPQKEYESLSMVSYENSGVYVSRQPVPVNTPPTKETGDSYWALMFPVDPQIKDFEKQLQEMAANLNNAIANMQEEIANNNQNVLDQIAAKFAQQDAVITKATTDVANFIDTANHTITEYTKKVDDFIAEYEPPAEAYGLLPQLVITANPTATINAVQGSTVRTGTVPSSGVLYLNLNAYGQWRVTATFQAQEMSQNVTVDDVKQYTMNLTQAERDYKITITNNSNLPIIGESLYQVTGPNGFSQSHNMAVTTAWECDVPMAGTYTIEAKIANLLPSKNRTSGTTEYVPTSISGSIIYTTVDTATATVTNEQETTSATLSIPKLSVTLTNASTYQEIQIQPPVVTEKSTDIYQNSDFAFIPWARGNWFMRNSTSDFEATETISSLSGYSGGVELMPEQDPPNVELPTFTFISDNFKLSVDNSGGTIFYGNDSTEIRNNIQNYYNSKYGDTIIPVAINKRTGNIRGKLILDSYGWTLDDGSKITDNHIICNYIPAIGCTAVSGESNTYNLHAPNNDTLAAFKHPNVDAKGIAIGIYTTDSNGQPRGGLSLSNMLFNPGDTVNIPNYNNAVYFNVDHVALLMLLINSLFYHTPLTTTTPKKHQICRIYPPTNATLQYASSAGDQLSLPIWKNSVSLPQSNNKFKDSFNEFDYFGVLTSGTTNTPVNGENMRNYYLTGALAARFRSVVGTPNSPAWPIALHPSSGPLYATFLQSFSNGGISDHYVYAYQKGTSYSYPVFYIT